MSGDQPKDVMIWKYRTLVSTWVCPLVQQGMVFYEELVKRNGGFKNFGVYPTLLLSIILENWGEGDSVWTSICFLFSMIPIYNEPEEDIFQDPDLLLQSLQTVWENFSRIIIQGHEGLDELFYMVSCFCCEFFANSETFYDFLNLLVKEDGEFFHPQLLALLEGVECERIVEYLAGFEASASIMPKGDVLYSIMNFDEDIQPVSEEVIENFCALVNNGEIGESNFFQGVDFHVNYLGDVEDFLAVGEETAPLALLEGIVRTSHGEPFICVISKDGGLVGFGGDPSKKCRSGNDDDDDDNGRDVENEIDNFCVCDGYDGCLLTEHGEPPRFVYENGVSYNCHYDKGAYHFIDIAGIRWTVVSSPEPLAPTPVVSPSNIGEGEELIPVFSSPPLDINIPSSIMFLSKMFFANSSEYAGFMLINNSPKLVEVHINLLGPGYWGRDDMGCFIPDTQLEAHEERPFSLNIDCYLLIMVEVNPLIRVVWG